VASWILWERIYTKLSWFWLVLWIL